MALAVSEPASDLAVALALASVVTGRAVPADLVAFGELGLAGEVRIVPGADRRLAEARHAGFTTALVPGSAHYEAPEGMCVHGVRTLADALDRALAPAARFGGGPAEQAGYHAQVAEEAGASQLLNDTLAMIAPGARTTTRGWTGSCRRSTGR